ncbi:MAG TPA: transposase [Christensenellaceae bacterium]|nr:transposase [Christensenellaceae bacterium]
MYKKRNAIERFCIRIMNFRRTFTCYEKLDIVFSGFINFTIVIDAVLVLTSSN